MEPVCGTCCCCEKYTLFGFDKHRLPLSSVSAAFSTCSICSGKEVGCVAL